MELAGVVVCAQECVTLFRRLAGGADVVHAKNVTSELGIAQ